MSFRHPAKPWRVANLSEMQDVDVPLSIIAYVVVDFCFRIAKTTEIKKWLGKFRYELVEKTYAGQM